MEFTIATWVFVTVFCGITFLSVMEDRAKLSTMVRFRRYIPMGIAAPERRRIERTFQQRIMAPIIESMQAMVNTRISDSFQNNLRMKMLNAGYPPRVTPVEFLVKSGIQVLVIALAAVGIQVYLEIDPIRIALHTALVLAAASLLMGLLLREKGGVRKTAIERELPELLDYIQVAVEAGLSIDSAIERIVAEQSKSIMGYEFKIYLHDMKMGLTRTVALQQMTQRTASQYVKNFTDGVTQAVKTGMPLANILHIIRKDIYDDIRNRAEKRAYRAPVVMMIPMVLFIFPTIFIITLAPAVLKLMSEMKTMGF